MLLFCDIYFCNYPGEPNVAVATWPCTYVLSPFQFVRVYLYLRLICDSAIQPQVVCHLAECTWLLNNK